MGRRAERRRGNAPLSNKHGRGSTTSINFPRPHVRVMKAKHITMKQER